MRSSPFLYSIGFLILFLGLAFTVGHLYVLDVSNSRITIGSPFSTIPYAVGWISYYPEYFMKWCGIMAVGLGSSFLGTAAIFHRLRANKPMTDMHGSARFANSAEVNALNLLDNKGAFIGGYKGKYLRHDGGEHVMVAAPTRAGKGVALVIPTLLTWPDSAIITDIKGELWELTSGWRQNHANNKCYKLDLGDPSSACFNPLDTIAIGTQREIADIQNIASMLVDPDGKGMDGRDGHWRKAAHALISGLICYAINKIKRSDGNLAGLPDVAALMTPSDRDFESVIEELVNYDDDEVHDTIIEFIKSSGRQHAARQGEEAASVLSTASNYLTLYKDPIAAKIVSRSDFDVSELVNGSTPASLYLTIKPSDKTRLMPAIRLILTVVIRGLTRDLDFVDGRAVRAHSRRMLLMLDELPALGKLDVLTDTIAYMSTYGLKAMIIIQDYNQLWDVYGKNETLTANCHVRTVFAPNVVETAKVISAMAGTTTRVKRQKHGNTKMTLLAREDDTYSEVGRPLLTPEEVMRLKSAEKNGDTVINGGELLVFVSGSHVIKGTQPLYFHDQHLQARASCESAA